MNGINVTNGRRCIKKFGDGETEMKNKPRDACPSISFTENNHVRGDDLITAKSVELFLVRSPLLCKYHMGEPLLSLTS